MVTKTGTKAKFREMLRWWVFFIKGKVRLT